MAKLNRQEIAINILTCGSYKECAEKSNISIRGLTKLRKDPAFIELVKQTKKEMFAEAMSKAQAASGKAIDVLKEIMKDGKATDSSRVAAARTIIEIGTTRMEQEEILDKLDEIERRAKQ